MPKTDFPMRASLPEREPEIEKEIFENDLYEKILKKNKGHESFVLHDGPPYANGEIHIGHSLNAKVVLYAEGDMYKFINDNLKLLQSVFITSGIEIEENNRTNEIKLGVKVEQAEGKKCERCWMYSESVGEDKDNPTICARCSDVLKD